MKKSWEHQQYNNVALVVLTSTYILISKYTSYP